MPRALGQKDAKTILFLLSMARRHLIPKKLGEAHYSVTFGSFEFRIIFEPRSLYYDNGWKEGSGYCLSQYFGGELDGTSPRLSNWPEIGEIFQLAKELAAN